MQQNRCWIMERKLMGRSSLAQRIVIAAAIAVSLPLIAWLVYLDGGTMGSMPYLFYVPIVVASFALGDLGAVLAALVAAGLAALIPLSVAGHQRQPLDDILIRSAFFYAVALLTSRLATGLEAGAAQSASLLSISEAISGSLRIDQVLSTITEKAVELMKAKACSISLLDREAKKLNFAASTGLSQQYRSMAPITVEESQLDRQALSGQAVSIHNAASDFTFPLHEQAKAEGISSILCAPLIIRERRLGVIRIYSQWPRKFSRRDHRLLCALASHAAVAIENARLYESLGRNYWDTIRALARAIEARDPYTLGHSERVTHYALAAGQELGLSQKQMEIIRFGGILHDIGKIGVPEETLGQASDPADVISRLHPLIGRSILEPVEFLAPALEIVQFHHERYDGRGYPEGLAGEAIPLLARLVAIANVYDHLTTDQPSRPALEPARACGELKAGAGAEFDPDLLQAFCRTAERSPDLMEPTPAVYPEELTAGG